MLLRPRWRLVDRDGTIASVTAAAVADEGSTIISQPVVTEQACHGPGDSAASVIHAAAGMI